VTIVARSKEFAIDQNSSNRWKDASESIEAICGAIELDPFLLAGAAPACLVERNGHCVLLNEAMAATLRLPIDQIRDRLIADFFPFSMPVINRWFGLADVHKPLPDRQLTWEGRHYQVTAQPIPSAVLGFETLSLTAFDVSRHIRLARSQRASRRRLAALAHQDDLTGLLNRRGLELQLHRELRHAFRDQRPLSLLMIDVDRFKDYNDGCGHLQGDFCLRLVSTVLRDPTRGSRKMAGRFGGEEFLVLLPDTDEIGATLVAERLRTGVESLQLRHPATDQDYVTISVGVASLRFSHDGLPIERYCVALKQAADAALYRAKAAGRNRVESCDVRFDGSSPPKVD
jgi:diguanylate cyclase (GGDEF)-like protein